MPITFDTETPLHLMASPDKVHFIVQADRPGGTLFTVKLEYEYFPPRSGKNKFYDFAIVQWPVENGKGMMNWLVAGIPLKNKEYAEKVAAEVGLVIKHGSPIMFGGSKEEFPLKGPNVYSLESNPKSKVYSNDPATIEKMRQAEMVECDKIIQGDMKKLEETMMKQGYTPQQFARMKSRWDNGDLNYDEPPERLSDGQHRHKE